MPNNIITTSTPFTDQMLDEFRQHGDPLADEVIEVFATQYGTSIQELADQLQNMIRMPNDIETTCSFEKHFPNDKNICAILEKYFTQAVELPEWVDQEKLKLGGDVFQDHFFSGIMILGCASLPITYVCQPDTKVLGFTRRLIDDAPKRLVETAQMVIDVMGDGGLHIKDKKLNGKGVQSILKIRLIHASVRYLMLHKTKLATTHENNIDPNNFLLSYVLDSVADCQSWYGTKKPDVWNTETDGVPINNEALAIILLTFSYTILHGLKEIGVKINKQQRDAYFHSWNVVGYLLGVDQQFLNEFTSYEKVKPIFLQILSRRRGQSDDGVLLEDALLDAFVTNAIRLTPFGRLLHVRRLARLITSLLVSRKTYTSLGLKLSFYDYIVRFFVWLGVRLFGFFVNYGFLRPIADYMFGRIAQSLWDWRKDFDEKDKTTPKKALLIPKYLTVTSFASGKYKNTK